MDERDENYRGRTRKDWEFEEQLYYEQEEAARLEKEEQEAEDRESAIRSMVDWFFENFEDPQNEGYYDREDGVPLFPFGGPFNARDMIDGFDHDYPNKEWRDAAIERIEKDGIFDWSPTAEGEFYEHPDEHINVADREVFPDTRMEDAVETLLAKVERLERRLDEIPPTYGHNNPPNEIGLPPYNNEDQISLKQIARVVRDEIQRATPDPNELNDAALTAESIGKKVTNYAIGLADIAAKEAVKTGTKMAVIAAGASLIGFDLTIFGNELIALANDIFAYIRNFL